MARSRNTLASQLANFTIDTIDELTNTVRGFIGIRIGGVFTYNNTYRTANLMNNPTKTRYAGDIPLTPAGGEFVGEKYVVETRLLPNKDFLDSVGGLEGFTHDSGYMDTLNTNVQQNMSQSLDNAKKNSDYVGDGDDKLNDNYTVDAAQLSIYNVNGKTIENLSRLEDLNYYKNKEVNQKRSDNLYFKRLDNEIKEIKDNSDSYINNGQKEKLTEIYTAPITPDEQKARSKNGKSVDNKTGLFEGETTFISQKKYIGTSAVKSGDAIGVYDERQDDNHILKVTNTSHGNFGNIITNKGSLLNKTNELFKEGKIGSMINRFHRSEDNEKNLTQTSVNSEYGLSRGRNLTKRNPDLDINGYDNPYCRVWTSHYQYSKFSDLIRHSGFNTEENKNRFNEGILRPNNAIERLGEFSSLQDNGLPRIAPMSKEDVKRCMFSIENLAWKDINFNADVDGNGDSGKNSKTGKVLSEEQRGPNGGRIMWFPPYNIKVNENVSVNWNTNNFIGRGEPIYTYTNTERTGTLQFTILVDHPSVVDYWANSKETKDATAENEQDLLRFFAGCDDGTIVKESEVFEEEETGTNQGKKNDDIPTTTPKPEDENWDVKMRYFVFFPNNFSGVDYYKKGDVSTPLNYLWSGAHSGGTGYEVNRNPDLGIGGCVSSLTIKGGEMKGGGQAYWHYEVDNDKATEALYPGNYKDTTSFGLNRSDGFSELIQDDKVRNTLSILEDDVKDTFTFEDLLNTDFSILNTYFGSGQTGNIQDNEFEIKCYVRGYASSHGYKEKNLGEDGLAKRRANFLKKYLESLNFIDSDNIIITDNGVIEVDKENRDVSSLDAKLGRCADVTIGLVRKKTTPELSPTDTGTTVSTENRESEQPQRSSNANETIATKTIINTKFVHYDDEYEFFKRLGNDDKTDLIRRNLVEKVRFFDPAFHSITPEGFNARLTFLHQCTRQGPTMSASDMRGESPMGAGNLSFGRPPVCVLRIGDFYFTKIIIDSLSIDYDASGGMQWDLNPEGIGIQPMLANVTLGIKFLGGSDLSGPIARLQNAVSYNFFANASVYDRRADYRGVNTTGDTTTNGDTTMIWEPLLNDSEGKTTKHRGISF